METSAPSVPQRLHWGKAGTGPALPCLDSTASSQSVRRVASATPSDLSAEERALLRLARQDIDDEGARFLRAQTGIDWQDVAALALRGGIAGLVERNLRQLGLGGLQRNLALASLHTEATNRMLLRETVALCAEAGAKGVAMIPLKGIALIGRGVYANLGFRSMCDVDLLCRPDQFEQVLGILRNRGFVETGYVAVQRDYYHHVSLVKPVGNRQMMFELHWQPTYGFFDFEKVVAGWHGRLGRVRTVDGDLPSLAPTDLLLSVSLHLATHRFRAGLKWLVDIAEICRCWQATIDWERLWSDARKLGAVRALSFAFRMAGRLLDAPVGQLPASGLIEQIGRRLCPDTAMVRSEPQPGTVSSGLINLIFHDDGRDGLRLLMHKAAEVAERRHIDLRFLRWGRQRRS